MQQHENFLKNSQIIFNKYSKKKHNVHDCQLSTYLKIKINVVATGLSLEVCTKIWHNLQPETLNKLLVKLNCITTII